MILWTIDFMDKCHLWVKKINFINLFCFKSDLFQLTRKYLSYTNNTTYLHRKKTQQTR